MKKFGSYVVLMLLLIGSVAFAACCKTSATIDNLVFTFEKNSAQIVSEQDDKYVKLKLDIKNNSSDVRQVNAEDFSLSIDNEAVKSDVIFGNNIIDQMDSETIESMGKANLILSIKVDKTSGAFSLKYKGTTIVDFNLKG